MLTAAAPEIFQVSVAEPPAEMLGGLASKELTTGSWRVNRSQPGIRAVAKIRMRHSVKSSFFIQAPPNNLLSSGEHQQALN
jgi:hypothetical protein